ncbi:MAG TPA: PIN domain-containing protein [Patescibacteria group bacterium]|nr:PIN domain-containing protein [Patescibacteria group bacterium]
MPSKSQPTPVVALKEDDRAPENPFALPPKLVGALADEVAKTLATRLPNMLPRPRRATARKKKKAKTIEYGIFLDTSAIIDGRIFDVLHLGLLNGVVVIIESILLELKHLADSQDMVKRERGKKGLDYLEKLKKSRVIKVVVLSEEGEKGIEPGKKIEVDERLIKIAKNHKGKVITCDSNLEKKATIENVQAINVNALANALKVIAVPGESLHVKLLHPGKDVTQGVGYLEDGTMIVVEEGSTQVGRSVDVVVSRVIQTSTGRILFAKRI